MSRRVALAVMTLGLLSCGPGNQRSGVLPQADTPPDPPATGMAQSSAVDQAVSSSSEAPAG